MKFICQSCGRDFDIGAPKGMQLPCPACGGMLVDSESSGEEAPSAPAAAPPAPSAEPSGGAAEGSEVDEFSLDAAELFAAKAAGGQAEPAQPAAPAPPPQPAQPPQPPQPAAPAPPPQPAPAPQQWAQQPQPRSPLPPAPVAAQDGEAEQYGAVDGGEEEYVQPEGQAMEAEGEAAYGEEGYPPEALPQEGYLAEGTEGFEEEAAHPLVLMLGWVLFGVTFVGILAMGYFLKIYYVQAKSAATSAEDRARIQKLEKDLADQASVILSGKKDLEKETERADKLAEEMNQLRTKIAGYEVTSKDAATVSKRLQETHDTNVEALRKAGQELEALRKRVAAAEVAAVRGVGRVKGAAQALRAAELIDRPAFWGQALGFLGAAIAVDEDLDAAWLLRGHILARLGRGEEAVTSFDRVDRLAQNAGAGGHARALVAAGDVCRTRLKDDGRAAAYYRRAAEAAPGSPYGRLGEIRGLILADSWEAALGKIEEGTRAVKAGNADATPLKMVQAEVLAGNERERARAIEAVSEVIGADPVLVPALDLRARLLEADGQREAAVADLARAAELDPFNSERLLRLGKTFLELKRPAAAERVLQRAVELLPESAEALTVLARALIDLRKYEDAVVRLAEVLGRDAGNIEAFRMRGEARVLLGRVGEGISDLEESLRRGRDDARTRMVLSRAYATSPVSRYKIPAKAVEHAQAAVDLTESRDPGALSTLAQAFAAKGNYARAANEMRRAIKLEPGDESYRALLRAFEKRAR